MIEPGGPPEIKPPTMKERIIVKGQETGEALRHKFDLVQGRCHRVFDGLKGSLNKLTKDYPEEDLGAETREAGLLQSQLAQLDIEARAESGFGDVNPDPPSWEELMNGFPVEPIADTVSNPDEVLSEERRPKYLNETLALSSAEIDRKFPHLEEVVDTLDLGHFAGAEMVDSIYPYALILHLDDGKKLFFKDRPLGREEPLRTTFNKILQILNRNSKVLHYPKPLLEENDLRVANIPLEGHDYTIDEYIDGISLSRYISKQRSGSDGSLPNSAPVARQIGGWAAFNFMFGSHDAGTQNFRIGSNGNVYQVDFTEEVRLYAKDNQERIPIFRLDVVLNDILTIETDDRAHLYGQVEEGFNEVLGLCKQYSDEISTVLNSTVGVSLGKDKGEVDVKGVESVQRRISTYTEFSQIWDEYKSKEAEISWT